MKRIYLILLALIVILSLCAQQQYRIPVKPVKNVILMIPDGTSTSVLAISRWYQIYNDLGGDKLNLDPYLCGLVKTYQSNAPVPDSAPAMSAYTTGVPAQAGNIAIYPQANLDEDILEVDTLRAFQPLATVMEAAKTDKKKALGLVVTVDFCHATPAACVSHHYNRAEYKYLAPQIAYQDMDVVFGGGASAVTNEIRQYLKGNETDYYRNNIKAFRNYNGEKKLWALFSDGYLPYDLDRDNEKVPSLAEMTEKALMRLSKSENGFFLMVEGSQVDAAAHATDPIGIITEFLAFDKAVGAAIDFARKDGKTAVVIMPDHGNSGFNFPSRRLLQYTHKGLKHTFEDVSKYKKTAKGLEQILLKTKPDSIKPVFKQYTDIDLSDEELDLLLSSKNYKTADYTQVGNTVNMISSIAHIMTSHTYFDFISGNHTGEDVFLAAYHPQGDLPYGLNTNTEINRYLCDLIGLDRPLPAVTDELYAKHTDVFKGKEYEVEILLKDRPILLVKKGNKELSIPAFSSVAFFNGEPFKLGSVTVYIDKNNTFYLPSNLVNKL